MKPSTFPTSHRAALLALGLVTIFSPTVYSGESWLTDPNKPWHLGLSVREEYTDNVDTTTGDTTSSFNTVINPSFTLDWRRDNTSAELVYDYSATFYSDAPIDGDVEQSHTVGLALMHNFTPRFGVSLSDTFVSAIDPELTLSGTNGVPTIVRRRGDYIANTLSGGVRYGLTERWTLTVGGGWSIWRYDDDSTNAITGSINNIPGISESKLNDRQSYQGNTSLSYAFNPRTSVALNYAFDATVYEDPNLFNTNNIGKDTDSRNSDTHTLTVSASHSFSPKLRLNVGGGATYTEFGNGDNDVSPAADLSLTYLYLPEASVAFGFTYGTSVTELGTFRDADTASVFLKGIHPFTGKLRLGWNLVYVRNDYDNPDPSIVPKPESGAENGILVSMDLSYEVTKWLAFQLGYSYDRVISDFTVRDYVRNRAYLGAKVTY